MQTACPECTSSISLPNPDTDPGTFARCDGCGDRVQPGAFLCPHCQTGLQVERTLLPADGGHGRCPECSEAVWVPPLASAMEQTSTAVSEPAEAPSIAPAVVEDEEPDDAVHVMGDDAQANAVQDSFLAPPEQTASTSVAYPPRRDEEAPRGRRGLGLFLGGAVGAGAALGVILSGVWVPPELPWHAEFLFANLISWVGFFCLGGALLGFLLGGSRRS